MKRYMGVDLHRNCFTVCTRTKDGRDEMRRWSIHSLAAFARTVKKDDEVAVEATGNTRLFTEALKDRGCRIVVVNPHEFEVISRSVKKTDEHDAKVLAEFLSKDMLPEVRMKNPCGHKVHVSTINIQNQTDSRLEGDRPTRWCWQRSGK